MLAHGPLKNGELAKGSALVRTLKGKDTLCPG